MAKIYNPSLIGGGGGTWGSITGTLSSQTDLQNALDAKADYPVQLYAGCLAEPVYTNNGGGSITVNSLQIAVYDNNDFSGNPVVYTVPAITTTLTDETTNYIVASYNSGTPVLSVVTDVNLINCSDVIPVLTVLRTGEIFHVLNWDETGEGMSEKLFFKDVKVERYQRESGCIISVDSSVHVTVSSGIVWYGITRALLDTVTSSTDNIYSYYHSSGNWVSSTNTTYNNFYYDNGSNRVELTANRYAVSWVFRGVEDSKHIYEIYGTGDYTLNEALEASVPSIPSQISSHAILVGKIIIQKSSSTVYSVKSAFDTIFSIADITSHSDLLDLQGGGAGAYYHSNQSINTTDSPSFVTTKLTNLTDGFLPYHVNDSTGLSNSIIYTDGSSVGIGTITPQEKLHLYSATGAIRFEIETGDTNVAGFKLTNSAGSYGLTTGSGNLSIYDFTSATTRLVITSTGKLGVATTAPDKMVEINSPDGNNLRLTYNDSDGSATNYTDFLVSSIGDLTITPSGGDILANANIDMPEYKDIFPDTDNLGLYRRVINKLGINAYTDHFRSGVIPTNYTWQSSPFNGTPSTLNYSLSSEYLSVADSVANRYFLSKAITNSAGSWQSRSFYGRFRCAINGLIGCRIDDGTDDNYVEILTDGSANNATLTVIFRHRTGGGAVTTVTSAILIPASEALILRIGVSSSYSAVGYLVSDTGSINIGGFSVSISGWAPTSGRAGIIVETVGSANPCLADYFYNTFT